VLYVGFPTGGLRLAAIFARGLTMLVSGATVIDARLVDEW
jgi:hypothetical protein